MFGSNGRLSRHRSVLTAIAVLGACAGANASIVTYIAYLDGPSEAPPNASPGTGFAQVDVDVVAHTMRVQATFTGLVGLVTASHIHAATAVAGTGTAGVATTTPTFTGFPSGVSSGAYDHTFDMTLASSFNASFITAHGGTPAGAEAFLVQSMTDGKAYFNIHSNFYPGGEIRGFLQLVPSPGAAPVLGLAGLAVARRRRS